MTPELPTANRRKLDECVIKVGASETEIAADLHGVLMEVRVETSRHQPWVATLVFESRRDEAGRWTVLDAGVFKPWEPIVIEGVFGSSTEEILRGFIREVRADYPEDPGATTVTIECRDQSLALDRRHVRKVWGGEQPTDDGAIVAEIVEGHGLSVHPDSGQGLSNLTLHQNATDIRFLRARAEANGYELIFERGEVYFGPQRVEAEPQPAIRVYAGQDTHCISLSIRADGHRPDKVAFDVAAATGAESIERVVEPDLALLGPETAASTGSDLHDFVWRLERQGCPHEEELLARALGRANEESFKVRAEGELNGSLYGHRLRVGQPVPLDGAGERLSGTYYVDRVTHIFTKNGYRQAFTLLRNAFGDNVGSSGGAFAGVLAGVL